VILSASIADGTLALGEAIADGGVHSGDADLSGFASFRRR
jgi:hypothetical protein